MNVLPDYASRLHLARCEFQLSLLVICHGRRWVLRNNLLVVDCWIAALFLVLGSALEAAAELAQKVHDSSVIIQQSLTIFDFLETHKSKTCSIVFGGFHFFLHLVVAAAELEEERAQFLGGSSGV